MSLFLILMCLLSICLGYVVAVVSWTGKLWESVRDAELPVILKSSLKMPLQNSIVCIVCSISLAGLSLAWYGYGTTISAEISSSFIIAAAISKIFLQPKIHGIFHLDLLLRSLVNTESRLAASGEKNHARYLHHLREKVTRELYAMKVVRSAAQVPSYDGSTIYLSIPGARADNYYTSQRSSTEK